MLSQQDRLLLDKIKSYYDYAEHQDAGFSVKRRESLSYIPKGLVRNSVFRINSLPQAEPEQEVRKRLGTSVGSGTGRTAAWVLSNRAPAGPQAARSEPGHEETPQPISEAEFRPPAEMIKIWEEAEKSRRPLWNGKAEEGGRAGKANGQCAEPSLRNRLKGQENGFDLHEPLLILEDEDLGAITEESAGPSPENKSPVERAVPSRVPWKLMQELGSYEPEQGPPQLHPRIMQLAHLTEAELTEKMKNKVYQLARQYSLRIKGCKSEAHRRLTELEEEMKGHALTGQQEPDKKGKGKRKPALSLLSYEQVVLQESSPLTPLSSSSRDKSPKRFSFSPCSSSSQVTSPTSHRPISPVVAEKFNWPDVQELRSKYSCQARTEKRWALPVNRSRSAPEKMMDTERMLEHQCSKENVKRERCQQGRTQSFRGSVRETLSDVLPRAHACGTQERLCVTAEAPLENSHRVIVVEKLLNAPGAPDESYVQIRSPTSREKISLKAVAERCKAYQDSEEYRKREESIQEADPQKVPQQLRREKTDSGQQSLVKNLREKFQTLHPNS